MKTQYSFLRGRLRTRCAIECGNSPRRLFALPALMLLVSLAPLSSRAQVAATSNAPRPPQRRHARRTIDDQVKGLAKGLDLNEAQQSAVKKILEQRQLETLRLRRDPSISGSVRMERFKALQVLTVQRIRAVLNEEQRRKYNPLASEKLKREPERSVEDWLKVTTPHQ